MRPRPFHDFLNLRRGGWAFICRYVFLTLLLRHATAATSSSPAPLDVVLHTSHADLVDEMRADSHQPDSTTAIASIVARASGPAPTGMKNNTPIRLNAVPGDDNASHYSFSVGGGDSKRDVAEVEELGSDAQGLSERQAQGTNVFISVNTCLQPSFANQDDQNNPPQLSLYVSTSNPTPGPGSSNGATKIDLEQGYANYTLRTSNQVYLGVAAPQADIADQTVWNYEIAVSTDGFFHSYNDTGIKMYLTDSDPGAALLVTDNLTTLAPDQSSPEAIDAWAMDSLPLSVMVANVNNTAVQGVMHSYCGLRSLSSVIDATVQPANVRNGVTHNQPDSIAEQQFYVPGLNRSSEYFGFLSRYGNGSHYGAGVAGGGGTVFPSMTFPTKRDSNCAVIYNLTFCNTVEYAVPANPSLFPNIDDLKALYDNEAMQRYQNFNYSLQQIACNTTSTAQYSLARTCDDCARSYKTWLCAVTIPRCEDFSSPSIVQIPQGPADSADYQALLASGPQGYLMPRNLAQTPIDGAQVPLAALQNQTQMSWLATNSSRNNDTIAGKIMPGPYHEVLPCEDLCYDIVRDCPAALGFGCPQPGSKMMRASYGRSGNNDNGAVLCSAPGSVYRVNAATPGAVVQPGRILLLSAVVLYFVAT